MEIPGNNELRIKNKVIQEKAKVGGKPPAKSDSGVAPSAKSGGTGSSEQIALSSRAKDIQRAHEAVRSAPDIRVDKVNQIKQKIADGTYRIESKDVADKVLKEIITESKFLG
ncbi:MAG: flagellar biosynthesis anti-sigma factor FlgM [Nitrospinae bacterium]|nr:flagellar biosynthesis anti-sigma factor FlgM [Nitrospinota bacterium]